MECLGPVGEYNLRLGIIKELSPDMVATHQDAGCTHEGHPTIVEAGVCLGGKAAPSDAPPTRRPGGGGASRPRLEAPSRLRTVARHAEPGPHCPPSPPPPSPPHCPPGLSQLGAPRGSVTGGGRPGGRRPPPPPARDPAPLVASSSADRVPGPAGPAALPPPRP